MGHDVGDAFDPDEARRFLAAEVGLDPAEFDRKLLDLLASDMHLRTEVARRLLPPIDETPVIPGLEDPYEVDERFYWGFTDRPIAGHTTWLFYDSKAKTIVGVVYHYPGEGLRRLDDGEWTADEGQPAWYCIFGAEAGEHELLGADGIWPDSTAEEAEDRQDRALAEAAMLLQQRTLRREQGSHP